jgi:hypothetical protein
LAEQIKGRANAIAGAEIVTEVRTWTAPGKVEQTTRPTAREPVVRATAEDPMEAFDGARRAWRKRRSTRP